LQRDGEVRLRIARDGDGDFFAAVTLMVADDGLHLVAVSGAPSDGCVKEVRSGDGTGRQALPFAVSLPPQDEKADIVGIVGEKPPTEKNAPPRFPPPPTHDPSAPPRKQLSPSSS
jgi:hypothetical protein